VRDTERWLRETEARVNAECEAVQVRALRLARRADYDAVEEGARNKRKVYRCVCVSERPVSSAQVAEINALRDLVIEQKTPLRVLVRYASRSHCARRPDSRPLRRRSLLTRRRTVHSFRLEPINARAFLLDIETQAGTYVKELVHGDRGRTTPSVSSLLRCPVDILQLDVLELITQAR
jgi:tRNA pseudouridine synthase 10